jgi:tricorn protease
MAQKGYYRFPAIHGSHVVFVCEDDLWSIQKSGGRPVRITTNLGKSTFPRFSPNGKKIAFTGFEEGNPEVYIMDATGENIRRITYFASMSSVRGWSSCGKNVFFTSNYGTPHRAMSTMYTVSGKGGNPECLNLGIVTDIAVGPDKTTVLGKFTSDPARWKRYRGGRAGVLLIDNKGSGKFSSLIKLNGNLSSPMWINERIFFLSDHEGIGNIYSCRPDGSDLKRHTNHRDFYARFPSTDGKSIVYHAGGDLYILNPHTNEVTLIPIDFSSPKSQTGRKFVSSTRYLENYSIHPEGHSLLVTTRGKPFHFNLWEGPVTQAGKSDGVRYRLSHWLANGKSFAALSDEKGSELIEIHNIKTGKIKKLKKFDFGRPYYLKPSPDGKKIALLNNRHQLWLIDISKNTGKIIDQSDYMIGGIDWSPDSQWIALSCGVSERCCVIRLIDIRTLKKNDITEGQFLDVEPVFDPEGKYLYFLSFRSFDPVIDFVTFDYNFPKGFKPYVLTLNKDLPSPLVPVPRAPGQPPSSEKEKKNKKKLKVKVDFKNITSRIQELPLPEGLYDNLEALPGGRVLFTSQPIEGRLARQIFDTTPDSKKSLVMFTMGEKKTDRLITGITHFSISSDKKTLCYQSGKRLRTIKAGDKPDDKLKNAKPSRKSGWIDLNRISLCVSPAIEWKQMFNEAWRLQKENFWTPDMSGVDWELVRKQYFPLVERIGSRGEFSDLMWEMQGELGTSHAYEFGGDYRTHPRYPVGFLGADFVWDSRQKGYKITHIVQGDPWDRKSTSPLMGAGLHIKSGDILKSIDGIELTQTTPPGSLLLNKANRDVSLGIRSAGKSGKTITVTVRTLSHENNARYREWVENNRKYIHKKSRGRVGYIHIPDCGPKGYSEFHRSFMQEVDHDGLIIDVRFNGGGHVSALLLEKLARRRIAYTKCRWSATDPYPDNSPAGPMVAITNEGAASDGDIFSQAFKLMKLGPLIGKRTWGGVIGISVRDTFVDNGLTTQPQYSFWFEEVGWNVENHGVEPDIEVEIMPQDYRKNKDPQMDRALLEIQKQMKEHSGKDPDLGNRPVLTRPELP